MPKSYYADYVNHCLRFYFRYSPVKGFKNDIDKINYTAVEKIVKKLDMTDIEVLRTVFMQDGIVISENISIAAEKHGKERKQIWSLVNYVTSKIAKERKLV